MAEDGFYHRIRTKKDSNTQISIIYEVRDGKVLLLSRRCPNGELSFDYSEHALIRRSFDKDLADKVIFKLRVSSREEAIGISTERLP